MNTESMYTALGITPAVHRFGEEVLAGLRTRFDEIDRVAEYNQCKVIGAMQKNRVDATHFAATTGYGYNDAGRDNLERVYADCFHTEAALVRPQITCGTHALTVALSANLLPGDTLLSPVGAPYDTLEEVIGIRPSACSLKEYGVHYRQVDLLPDYGFDYPAIEQALRGGVKLVTIQRSKGYATRPTFSVQQIGELIAFCKRIDPNVICMVDNCYGEFVETIEPTNVGADLMVGSLIKNPGGGLAPAGGYIVGKKKYVENAAYRLLSPGLGKEVGATLGVNGSFYQGFFLAPTVTAAALKGAVFAANVYEKLGFAVVPNGTESRHDIIQAITFGTPEGVIRQLLERIVQLTGRLRKAVREDLGRSAVAGLEIVDRHVHAHDVLIGHAQLDALPRVEQRLFEHFRGHDRGRDRQRAERLRESLLDLRTQLLVQAHVVEELTHQLVTLIFQKFVTSSSCNKLFLCFCLLHTGRSNLLFSHRFPH